MNRKIDSIVKQAKRSGKRRRVLPCKVAVCDDTAVKKSALRVLGPYKEKEFVTVAMKERLELVTVFSPHDDDVVRRVVFFHRLDDNGYSLVRSATEPH